MIATNVKEMSPEELEEAAEEFWKAMGSHKAGMNGAGEPMETHSPAGF